MNPSAMLPATGPVRARATEDLDAWALRCRRLALAVAAVVAATSTTVLAAWAVGRQDLTGILPGAVAVKVNTALGTLLLACAWLAPHVMPARRGLVALRVLASAAALLTLATLAEYATGIDLGIDNALFPEGEGAAKTVIPGRMAVLTAASLAALCLATLLHRASLRFAYALQATLGAFAAFVAAASLFSYAYGAHGTFLLTSSTPMGLATAAMVFGLAYVVGASEPHRGFLGVMGHQGQTGRLVRRAIPLAIASAVGMGFLVVASQAAGWWPIEVATATRSAIEVSIFVAIFGVLGFLSRASEERAEAERERATRTLEDGKRLLDETERVAGTGGWALDVATGRVVWTDQTFRIHGLERGAFDPSSPSSDLAFYAPADRAILETALHRAIETGQPYDLELDLRTANGAMRRVRTTGRPEVRAGKVVRVHGHVSDVTDLRAAERAVRESEERYRLLAENMGDLVVASKPDGPWEYVSPSARGVLGYEPGELLGRTTIDLIHPEDLERIRSQRAQLVREGERDRFQLRLRRKDGTYVWIEAQTTAAKDDAGRTTRLISVVRDVTDRKAAEAEILALNADLERRVAARTADLEAANKELETFAYSVSHDLRAPLRAIDGFSHALLTDYANGFDAEGQDMLRRVRAASQRMGSLIDDVLKLSRVGRAELRRERVDLTSLANEVVAELRARDPARRVEVTVEPGIVAQGDPALLRLVLQNYLDNAWKFTGKRDEASIRFGVEPTPEGPVYYVRDNGAGFDPAYSDKLFGAFQRLHSPSEFPGNGIGLATVRRIVNRHGGRCWASGQVDRGATFSFTLPQEAEP